MKAKIPFNFTDVETKTNVIRPLLPRPSTTLRPIRSLFRACCCVGIKNVQASLHGINSTFIGSYNTHLTAVEVE